MRARRLLLSASLAAGALGAPAASWPEDELQFFADEARVLTASRRLEPVAAAPSAVEVITAEEIRASGAVHLADLLRFKAGMNVLDGRTGEGNRAIVSIRGFPAEFVDNMQVLLDGRSVYTGLSGGAVWEALPVQLQDIDRIEIVRGPSAALYGSNAALGVVHIITRAPAARRTLGAEALGGNRGLHREAAFFEDAPGRLAYRLSVSHKAQQGNPLPSGAEGNDWLMANKGNLRAAWRLGRASTVEAFAGGSWDNLGVVDPALPMARFRHHFQMLRHSAEGRLGSFRSLLSRRDDTRTYVSPLGALHPVRELQYDAEVEHEFAWSEDRLRTNYGASVRHTGISSTALFGPAGRRSNGIERGFLRQAAAVAPGVDLIAAGSLEHSDTGGLEPAYQTALLLSPWSHHVFRLSHALAPTIPTLYQKWARQSTGFITLLGNSSLAAQRLRSYEAGYQGAFLERRARGEANVFYVESDNLSRAVVQSFAPFVLTFDNGNGAVARGVELKSSYRWSRRLSVYANYTHETVSDKVGIVNVRRGTPPHKVNLGGAAPLGRGVSLSLNAGYQDRHTLSSQASNTARDIPAYWRLDGQLTWGARDLEVFLAGQNLGQRRHREYAEGLEAPRTYQLGVRWLFACE